MWSGGITQENAFVVLPILEYAHFEIIQTFQQTHMP